MRRVELDGSLDSLDAAYEAIYAPLTAGLDVPEFAHNLDALWDVLTSWIPGPIEVAWRDYPKARARVGPKLDRFLDVLRDVEQERPDFWLSLE